MNIGDKIKQIRKERHLTLSSFGKMVGMSVSFLSDIENGRSYPSLKKLFKIADALGISVSELLYFPSEVSGEDEQPYVLKGLKTPQGKKLLKLIVDFDYWDREKQELLISIIENMSK